MWATTLRVDSSSLCTDMCVCVVDPPRGACEEGVPQDAADDPLAVQRARPQTRLDAEARGRRHQEQV